MKLAALGRWPQYSSCQVGEIELVKCTVFAASTVIPVAEGCLAADIQLWVERESIFVRYAIAAIRARWVGKRRGIQTGAVVDLESNLRCPAIYVVLLVKAPWE